MYRTLKIIAIMTLTLGILLVGLVIYWLIFPTQPPVDTGTQPYRIVYPVNKTVEQGKFITYEFDYVKITDQVPQIHRRFVDGLVFDMSDDIPPVLGKAGSGIARVQIPIPETLPPGKYHIEIDARYELNPIRHYDNKNVTEDFIVVESKTHEFKEGEQ